MGRYMANDLLVSGFFNEIDIIVPVPLHKKREKERGYNQSEWIASGISKITGIPVNTNSIKRVEANSTQTRKSVWDRWENVQNLFAVVSSSELQGKHILLVDDVLTTGATIVSCASKIMEVRGVRISVLTLAAA